jgi:DNA invertase Pin-like site-specific DNA recombinase
VKLRAAVYARYSSDRQSPASIADQIRVCREYAERQGWQLLEDHVYHDDAVSGAGADRPEFNRLLAAASREDRAFDVLLVDDTSRLSRNLADSVRTVETLRFKGCRVVAVSQGIDSQHDQADVLMAVHGVVDSLYVKELAKKTHRGLQGRALQGFHTGGRCYGFDIVHDGDTVRYQINDTEAAVVRRIFEMSAGGASLKAIAKTFNHEHVPPARKRKGKQDATWCPNAIREMLRNETYIGRLIWNRSHFVKQPGSNKRVRRPRPESEWIISEKLELRIIDQALWESVQRRIEFVKEKFYFGNMPGLLHRAATSHNLLTGFIKCGICGHNLIIVAGRGKHGHPKYGCPYSINRDACTNRLVERADVLEQRLFAELQNSALRPEVIDLAVHEFERQLQDSLSSLDNRIGQMRQRSDQLQIEIGNLAATAAQCGPTPVLVKEINARQQELDGITRQLLTTEPNSVSAEIGRIRQFVTRELGDIRQLLNVDVQKARAQLAQHVTTIRMVPQIDGKKGHYVAEGGWNLLGGYVGETKGSARPHIRMVAGEGFEPSTFGL